MTHLSRPRELAAGKSDCPRSWSLPATTWALCIPMGTQGLLKTETGDCREDDTALGPPRFCHSLTTWSACSCAGFEHLYNSSGVFSQVFKCLFYFILF